MTEAAPRPLDGARDFSEALQELLGTARRQVQIYSQQLARPLYHDAQVVQLLSDFARSSRYARLQILIADSEPMLRQPHRLLPLIQRLGSRIELKKLPPANETRLFEFALADNGQYLRCEDSDLWRGHYHAENAAQVRKLRDVFVQAWTYAQPDPNLQRLVI